MNARELQQLDAARERTHEAARKHHELERSAKARFFSIGRPGQFDVDELVRQGKLPPAALEEVRTGAMIRLASMPDDALDIVAFGNDDPAYGAVARAELARRNMLDGADRPESWWQPRVLHE